MVSGSIIMADVDAVLQKVSSGLDVMIVELRGLRMSHEQLFADFSAHRRDDREDFSKVFTIIETNRNDRNAQFEQMIERFADTLKIQDQRITAIEINSGKAQGAGWVIVGIITFLGMALLGALSVITSHFWPK